MKEPTRYSMSTGLPVTKKVKSYPLKSVEQSFWDFISKHEQSRYDWRKQSGQINENNKESDQT